MSVEKPVLEVAREIFRSLGNDGVACVILHHFDFEEGGDIDFSAPVSDPGAFLGNLRKAVEVEGWQVVQVFAHELSGAYIVCRDSRGSGRYLLFDYCYDYRIRGHLILGCSELLENSSVLPWGGKGSHGFVELAYRFTKAAAKGKNPGIIARDLQPLYQSHGEKFKDWLQKRWDLQLKIWDEPSVTPVLEQLQKRLAKQAWSLSGVALKVSRITKPRGLWVECSDDMAPAIATGVAPCFRKTRKGSRSLKEVLGSTLVINKAGRTPNWKRGILKWLNCWLEASSGEEVVQFLVERNNRYQKWK